MFRIIKTKLGYQIFDMQLGTYRAGLYYSHRLAAIILIAWQRGIFTLEKSSR